MLTEPAKSSNIDSKTSAREIVLWLAINSCAVALAGFVTPSLPARLKLLGLFSIVFGIAVGWHVAYSARQKNVPRGLAIAVAALLAMAGDTLIAARSWSLHARSVRHLYLSSDIPLFAASPRQPVLPPTLPPTDGIDPTGQTAPSDPVAGGTQPDAQPDTVANGSANSADDTANSNTDNSPPPPPGFIPEDVRLQFRQAREEAAEKKSTLRAYLELRLASIIRPDPQGELPAPWSWTPHWAFLFRGGEILLAGVAAAVTAWQLRARKKAGPADATSPEPQQLS